MTKWRDLTPVCTRYTNLAISRMRISLYCHGDKRLILKFAKTQKSDHYMQFVFINKYMKWNKNDNLKLRMWYLNCIDVETLSHFVTLNISCFSQERIHGVTANLSRISWTVISIRNHGNQIFLLRFYTHCVTLHNKIIKQSITSNHFFLQAFKLWFFFMSVRDKLIALFHRKTVADRNRKCYSEVTKVLILYCPLKFYNIEVD